MSESEVLYHVDQYVATITLNRPAKLNAWTLRMATEVRAAMRRARDDDQVRVIVLTGSGRAFCAGADMGLLGDIRDDSERNAAPPVPAFDPTSRPDFHGPDSYFPAIHKPILCALNGVAAGIGFVYTLYCDIRFASSDAYYMTAFARRGAIAEHGTSWLLPRLVGQAHAADLLFSSRKVGATEAERMGLVNRVVPPAELMPTVYAYARQMAAECSPRSLRVMKRQLWDGWFRTLGEDVAVSQTEMALSFTSEDFAEGIAHFAERRPARFTGS